MFDQIVKFIRRQFNGADRIPLHAPVFKGNERKYVLDAIDSTFVSSVGMYVDKFEERVRNYTGAKYAVATVNGTSALHMALMLSGVKAGDLVITQPLTFIATCNAVRYIGADPLFIDIARETLSLCPKNLSEFLSSEAYMVQGRCIHKTSGRNISACVPMHTFGHPAKMDELLEICDKYSIPLVEDAAESLGSLYKDRQTGTSGLLGIYSFNGNKTITCGGGGMIVTNDESLAKSAKHLTTQAKVPHSWDFVHDSIGYNYRLPNINAALACAQMENLDDFILNKRQLSQNYKDFFKKMDIPFLNEPDGTKSNYWLNAILLEDRKQRDSFLEYTNDKGIMTRPSWTLMHKLPMFEDCIKGDLYNAMWIEERLVNIPSGIRL